ncbi:DUF4088 family protein [Paludibacterium sp.]|nr:DUF4088 family protein [Paludibacterium sp.]
MNTISVSLTDQQLDAIREELAEFINLGHRLGIEFPPPSLEEYLTAKVTGDASPLITRCCTQITKIGAERIGVAFNDVLRMARPFGFVMVSTSDDTIAINNKAKQLAERLVTQFGFSPASAQAMAEALVASTYSVSEFASDPAS